MIEGQLILAVVFGRKVGNDAYMAIRAHTFEYDVEDDRERRVVMSQQCDFFHGGALSVPKVRSGMNSFIFERKYHGAKKKKIKRRKRSCTACRERKEYEIDLVSPGLHIACGILHSTEVAGCSAGAG